MGKNTEMELQSIEKKVKIVIDQITLVTKKKSSKDAIQNLQVEKKKQRTDTY